MSDPIDEAYWWLIVHRRKYVAVIETRIVAALLRHIEKERQEPTDDGAAEMNGIIREITMSINGDDEPAFLDDAVRRALKNAVATERGEIADWLHTMSRRKHEEAENMTDYAEQLSLLGEMGAYFAACEWVKQRGSMKSPAEGAHGG